MALMTSNVLAVKFAILVVIAFMAVLAGQLQIAVAIRPDPPSNPDSQITGSSKLPARSGLIVEVLDHQVYTEDDSSALGLAIDSDWKLNAQSLTNKYPPLPEANTPHEPKFHAQGLVKAYPPPPSGNPTHSP